MARGYSLMVRLTGREKKKILTRASAMGVSISSYVRLRLCEEQPDLMQLASEKYFEAMAQMGVGRGRNGKK